MTQPDKMPVNNRVTPMQDFAMRFLSNKMEATAAMVGEAVHKKFYEIAPPNYSHIGGSVMSALRKKCLVLHLPELNAWRLSKMGREYVSTR